MTKYLLCALVGILSGCSASHHLFKGDGPQTAEEFAVLVEQMRFLSREATDLSLLDFAPATPGAEKVVRLGYFFLRTANITFEEGMRRLSYTETAFGLPSRDDRSRIYILLGPPDSREQRTQMMPGTARTERFEIWGYASGYVMTFRKDRFDDFVMLRAERH